MIDDEANKQHNLLGKKLSPTFDKYLSLIVYKVLPHPTAPHQSSQLLSTRARAVIWQQLEEEDSPFVWLSVFPANWEHLEKLRPRVLLVLALTHIYIFWVPVCQRRRQLRVQFLCFKASFFSQPDSEFSDTRWVIGYLQWYLPDMICLQIKAQKVQPVKSCMRSKVSVAKIVDTAHLYESVWISLIFSQFQETRGILKDESLCMSCANHHQFVLWLVVEHHKVTLVSQGMRSKTWGHPPNGIDSNWLTKNAQFHIFSLMLLYLYLQEIQVGRFSRVHEPNKIGLDRVSSVQMLLVEVWHFSKVAAFILSRTVGLCSVHCAVCIVYCAL